MRRRHIHPCLASGALDNAPTPVRDLVIARGARHDADGEGHGGIAAHAPISIVVARWPLGFVDERVDRLDTGIADIEPEKEAAFASGSLGELGLSIGETNRGPAFRAVGIHPDIIERVGHSACSHSRNRFTNRAAMSLRAPGEGVTFPLSPNSFKIHVDVKVAPDAVDGGGHLSRPSPNPFKSPRVFSPELAREAGKGGKRLPVSFPAASSIGGAL